MSDYIYRLYLHISKLFGKPNPQHKLLPPERSTSVPPVGSSSPQASLPKFRPHWLARNRGFDSNLKRANSQMDCNFSRKELANGTTPFEDPTEAGDNCFLDCDIYDNFFPSKRQSNLGNIPYSNPGFPQKRTRVNGNIRLSYPGRCGAVRPTTDMIKFPHRQRGIHTLTSNSRSCDETEDATDNIGNWKSYRVDTNERFDQSFRFLSKKIHSTGNEIDLISHLQWMRMAGINVDKEAQMFRQFVGGRDALNLGEYKFLIAKICSIYDLDYWDVLRKMSTFLDEEFQLVME